MTEIATLRAEIREIERRMAALERAERELTQPMPGLLPGQCRINVLADRALTVRKAGEVAELHFVELEVPRTVRRIQRDAVLAVGSNGDPVGLMLLGPSHDRSSSITFGEVILNRQGKGPLPGPAGVFPGPRIPVRTVFPGAELESWILPSLPPARDLVVDVRVSAGAVSRLRQDVWPRLVDECRAHTAWALRKMDKTMAIRESSNDGSARSASSGLDPKRAGRHAVGSGLRVQTLEHVAGLVAWFFDSPFTSHAVAWRATNLSRHLNLNLGQTLADVLLQRQQPPPGRTSPIQTSRSHQQELMIAANRRRERLMALGGAKILRVLEQGKAPELGIYLDQSLAGLYEDVDPSLLDAWRHRGFDAVGQELAWTTDAIVRTMDERAPNLAALLEHGSMRQTCQSARPRRGVTPTLEALGDVHEVLSRRLASQLKLLGEAIERCRESIEIDIADGAHSSRTPDAYRTASRRWNVLEESCGAVVRTLGSLKTQTEAWLRSLSIEDLELLAYQGVLHDLRRDMCLTLGRQDSGVGSGLLGNSIDPNAAVAWENVVALESENVAVFEAERCRAVAVGAIRFYERKVGLPVGSLLDQSTDAGRNFHLWIASCEVDPKSAQRFLDDARPDEGFVVDCVLQARARGQTLIPELQTTPGVLQDLEMAFLE